MKNFVGVKFEHSLKSGPGTCDPETQDSEIRNLEPWDRDPGL